MHKDVERILFTEEEIALRIDQLGKQITQDYKSKVNSENPLLAVGILRGATIFFSDIVRKIDLPVEFNFISMSSYGNESVSTGKVQIREDLGFNIHNREVLIIEDIIDSGNSISALKENFRKMNPSDVKLCAMLNKPARRVTEVEIDYCGFDTPDEFLVGYGLDFAQRYRNLPYVGVLKKSVYS